MFQFIRREPRNNIIPRLASALAAAVALLGLTEHAKAQDESSPLADDYGFLSPEIYKVDHRIGNLLLADLDGDKVQDVVVANNGRSRIELLLSTKRTDAGAASKAKSEVNDLADDRRLRTGHVAVNREVVSLTSGDFNGDGKADLAFYGTPAELIILYNDGHARFDEIKRINTGEALEGAGVLTTGDLNHDGRDDLALMAPGEFIVLYQTPAGAMSEPERVPHSGSNPWFARATDLNGDGIVDLAMLDRGNDDPIRVRFSSPSGKLGPELRFASETVRAISFGEVDGKKGDEILTIEEQSGRVKILKIEEGDAISSESRGRLIVYPLPPGGARGRSLDVGDLDGDGKADVVVSDPSSSQFLVFLQSGKNGLGAGQAFPNLSGGRALRLADFDGDGKAEAVVLSEQEKQVGRSTYSGGRLAFPVPMPVAGDPVALDVADLDGDKMPELIYLARKKPVLLGARGDKFELRALRYDKTSKSFRPFSWKGDKAGVEGVELKDVTDAPAGLLAFDINHDGQTDFLIFKSYGTPMLMLGRAGAAPESTATTLGPLTEATPSSVALTDLGGPAVLVSSKTYARHVLLGNDGQWQVKDQFNAARGTAKVEGAAALDMNGDGKKEIVLLDRVSRSLLFLNQTSGVYRPAGSLKIGAIDFQGMRVADFDADGREDLLVAGTDRFALVLTGGKGLRTKSIAGYETSREQSRFGDLAAGDVNSDGKPDIVLTDIAQHDIEIARYEGKPELVRALLFKIFEKKSFRDVRSLIEPREMAIGDVDGDQRNDIVLIVHDRVLIYRQDPGPTGVAPSKKK